MTSWVRASSTSEPWARMTVSPANCPALVMLVRLMSPATSGDSFLGKLQGLFDLTERMSVTKDKLELTGGKEALFRSASDMITKIGNFNANGQQRGPGGPGGLGRGPMGPPPRR